MLIVGFRIFVPLRVALFHPFALTPPFVCSVPSFVSFCRSVRRCTIPVRSAHQDRRTVWSGQMHSCDTPSHRFFCRIVPVCWSSNKPHRLRSEALIRTEGFATSCPDFNRFIVQIRSSWNKSSDCMSVRSLSTRGIGTTHLDSHLSYCSCRNERPNVDRVCILRIGLPGSSRIMPLSFGASESIQIQAPSTLVRSLPRQVESSPDGTDSNRAIVLFSAPTPCSFATATTRPHFHSSDRSWLEGTPTTLSGFLSVGSVGWEGGTTINRILSLLTATLEMNTNNQPEVSTLYCSNRMEQHRPIRIAVHRVAPVGMKSNDSCRLPSAVKY